MLFTPFYIVNNIFLTVSFISFLIVTSHQPWMYNISLFNYFM